MRVLVTGAEGFVGGHLLTTLLEQSHRALGLHFADHPGRDDVEWHRCDLRDRKQVHRVVERTKPDAVVHLAAISHVPDAQSASEIAFATNVGGALNLLEELSEVCPGIPVVFVSSGEVYGNVASEHIPIQESQDPAPSNVYGLTKLCGEHIAGYYRRLGSLAATIVRPFTQFGPKQTDRFVCSSFARQVARVMLGKAPPEVRVGNLHVRRDFTDVRDMSRAYVALVERDTGSGPYNISSGRSISIQDVIETLIDLSGRDIRVTVDSERVRPTDIPEMRGDSTLFRSITGWAPRLTFRQSLQDTLDFWVSRERALL
jgi:GDP-4-dehydro-6-deoxy-D-mannose reductase